MRKSQSQYYFDFIDTNVYQLGTCKNNYFKFGVIAILFAMGIGSWHLILGPYDFVPGSFLWTKDYRDYLGGYWWSNVLNWIFLNVIAGSGYFIAIETMQQYMMLGYTEISREVPAPKVIIGNDTSLVSNSRAQARVETQSAPTSVASQTTRKQQQHNNSLASGASPLRQHLPTGVTPVELSPSEEQEIARQREERRAQFAAQERIDAQYEREAQTYIAKLREQIPAIGIISGFMCGFTATTVGLARVMISLIWFFLISYLVEAIYNMQKPWSSFFFITKQPVFDGSAEFLTHYNNALFNGSFWIVMLLLVAHTFAFANLYFWKTLEQLVSKIGIFSIIGTLLALVVVRVLGYQLLNFFYEAEVNRQLEEPEVLNYTFNWILNWCDMVVVAIGMTPFLLTKVFNPAVHLDNQRAEQNQTTMAEEINQEMQ